MHVNKLIKSLPDLNLDIKYLANDHGPVWTEKKMNKIISLYEEWSEQNYTQKAVIVYDTMWESTKLMAKTIADGLMTERITAKVMPLSGSHRSDIATELIDAGAIIAGSSTLNNNLLPSMADVLSYTKGLRFKNLLCQSFGSYGWSGEACKQINEILGNLNCEFIGEPVRQQYVPDEECLKRCFELGVNIGKKLKEKVSK
jgi:flavorubredoxin